jgi:hypothetical protein
MVINSQDIQDGIECSALRTAQIVGKRKGRERV